MKSHRLSTYARITLIAVVAVVMTACATSPGYYEPDPYYSPRLAYYDYWYYPAIGAYYDPGARIYIYYEDNHWIRTRALPSRMRPYLGRHVTLRSPHDRPYEQHHRHRQRYQPERYRERDPAHHGDVPWIGTPRQQNPQRDRNDRRSEDHDRDRNGNDRRREPERGAVPVPLRPREPPTSTAPIKRGRQAEIRREESREQDRRGDIRRNKGHMKDLDRTGPNTGQPRQYRAPDSRRQSSKTPPQAVPGHRSPPTKSVPVKRDEKRQQRQNRKEETQHLYRKGDDRRGKDNNDSDAASQKRQRNQFEKYEQYR